MVLKNRHMLLDIIVDNSYQVGAEVGVFKADYSVAILNKCPMVALFSIDPWDCRDMKANVNSSELFSIAQSALEPFGERSIMLRNTSEEAFIKFDDESLDFIHIDANHAYIPVMADLSMWYSKVRSGGMFFGHDYKNLGKRKQVRKAVDEFFSNLGVTVNGTKEKCPSWWVIKP